MAKKWPKIFIIATLILSGFFISLSAWTQAAVTFSWVGSVFNGYWQSNAALPLVPSGPEPLPPSISILSPQTEMIFYPAAPATTTTIYFHLSAYTDPGNTITFVTLYKRTGANPPANVVLLANAIPGTQIYDGILQWSNVAIGRTCVSLKCAETDKACTTDSDCPSTGYTVFAEATDNNGLIADSSDLILHVAPAPTLTVGTFDLTTGIGRTTFSTNSNIKVKVTVDNPALFQTMNLFWAEKPTTSVPPEWHDVYPGGQWIKPNISGSLTNVMAAGITEKDYLLKVVGTTLAPLSQIIESDPVTYTLAHEICDNADDEDKDGNWDNGCLKINISIANTDGTPPHPDDYFVYIKPKAAADTEYKTLSLDNDPNFGAMSIHDRLYWGYLRGSRSIDYLVSPGDYDVKVAFNTSHSAPVSGGSTYDYSTNLNVSILGKEGTTLTINSGTGGGYYDETFCYPSCTNTNICTVNASNANSYACTFTSVMCLNYNPAYPPGDNWCSDVERNTNPGQGIFDITVSQ